MTPEERAEKVVDSWEEREEVYLPTVERRGELIAAIATAIREAEARGLDRAAEIADRHHETYEGSRCDVDKGHAWAAEDIAAAIRAEKERTP